MRRIVFVLVIMSMGILAACGGNSGGAAPPTSAPAAQPPAPTAVPTTAPPTSAPPTAAPTATRAAAAPTTAPASAPAAKAVPAPASGGPIKLTLAPDGTEARYLVREQLAQRNLPNDAVGVTKSVTGQIVLGADGKVVKDQSKFTVDMNSIATDQGMRDSFVRRNVLQTSQYPTAVFVPTEIKGLPTPLPASGEVEFDLIGDMTVRNVTKPVTWKVTGRIDGQALKGKATTAFPFATFDLTQPRVPSVLSIEDNIRLELDFNLVAGSA